MSAHAPIVPVQAVPVATRRRRSSPPAASRWWRLPRAAAALGRETVQAPGSPAADAVTTAALKGLYRATRVAPARPRRTRTVRHARQIIRARTSETRTQPPASGAHAACARLQLAPAGRDQPRNRITGEPHPQRRVTGRNWLGFATAGSWPIPAGLADVGPRPRREAGGLRTAICPAAWIACCWWCPDVTHLAPHEVQDGGSLAGPPAGPCSPGLASSSAGTRNSGRSGRVRRHRAGGQGGRAPGGAWPGG